LEYLLRNAILALLEYPTSTLLGVTKILVDKEYRTKVMEKVSDPVIKSFWTEEFTKYHDRLMADAIAPIQNKVGQFLSSSLIRNIVGQVKSSFDIRYVMDNQKILIMNLSKGRIGEDNSALLGAMMITKIQLAAMARVDMPESRRKDFYLYVDEFQNFATESFANILSEARKYRLNLILAHQYITQLDERVQNAVFGNVGTLITFRVGASDAEFLEKEFSPVFYMTDLVNLAKYNIYLKLMIDGVATSPFSANTLPPIDTSDTGVNYEKIIRVSAERYGTPRKIVEDKINRWSGVTSVEVKDKLEEIIKEERKAKSKKTPDSFSDISKTRKAAKNEIERSLPSRIKEQKEMNKGGGVILEHKREINKRQPVLPKNEYETECSVCSAKIKVPFKPDGQRPVFCKECLKEYRRAQMKLQNEIKSSERKQNFLTPKDKKAIESKKKNNRGELKALIEKAMSQREKE
jgi:CxxC-x17-CxxC domain-containing protein